MRTQVVSQNFRPCCMAIGFVGMPHYDVHKACDVVLNCLPEVPVLPSLQNLYPKHFITNSGYRDARGMPCLKVKEPSGKMFFNTSSSSLAEELTGFYESYMADDITPFGLDMSISHGQLAMIQELKNHRPTWKLIQFSILGPISFCLDVPDENGKPIIYNETFRDVVVKSLTMLVRWYEEKLKEILPGLSTIALVGEPSLQYYGSALVNITKEMIIKGLDELNYQTNSLICLHCCGNTDWSMVMESQVNAISFDAYNFSANLCMYASQIKRFLERGGMLAWGIVPNTEPDIIRETTSSLVERLETTMDCLVQKGISKRELVESSFIQPSCNTLGVSPEICEKILTTVREVSEQMRVRYFA